MSIFNMPMADAATSACNLFQNVSKCYFPFVSGPECTEVLLVGEMMLKGMGAT